MLITVTADDILRGHRRKYSHCPIALAIKRASGSCDVAVGIDTVSLNGVRNIQLPFSACQFRYDFDNKVREVHPFEFELTDTFIKAGAK